MSLETGIRNSVSWKALGMLPDLNFLKSLSQSILSNCSITAAKLSFNYTTSTKERDLTLYILMTLHYTSTVLFYLQVWFLLYIKMEWISYLILQAFIHKNQVAWVAFDTPWISASFFHPISQINFTWRRMKKASGLKSPWN